VKRLQALIGNTPGLLPLGQAMQRIAALQQLYASCAPADLLATTRVVADRDGTVLVAADNSATAAKLRQILPRLLMNLQKQSAKINGIQVQVQVKNPAVSARSPRVIDTLPIDLIDDFEKLAEQVGDPALKAALTRFVARRKSGG
jgi:hypothetical protein